MWENDLISVNHPRPNPYLKPHPHGQYNRVKEKEKPLDNSPEPPPLRMARAVYQLPSDEICSVDVLRGDHKQLRFLYPSAKRLKPN
jgi:hypothetical protein